VKIESRCGSVLAQRWNNTSLLLCTSGGRAQALGVHHHDVFGVIICPLPQRPHDFVGLHRAGLARMLTKTRLWKTPSAASAMSMISGSSS
jgi:hypothetical protein